ncbi:MAG: phosphoribosyl-ATP diphosphatase, partial [Thermoanaerobaculia bacterium]
HPSGPACHTGADSCFSRVETFDTVEPGAGPSDALDLTDLFAAVRARKESPVEGSYTNKLFEDGVARIAQKVGEEAVETALASVTGDAKALAGEAADLLYHLAVLLTARGVAPGDVAAKLTERRGAPRREKP